MTADETQTMAGFEIMAGADESPVILHVPHSSRIISPDARESILLSDKEIEAELDHMTDAHTALIASSVATNATVRPWQFTNLLSRLVVDPERFPDERESMRAVGMGAVYTHGSHGIRLRMGEEPTLVSRYFEPYAAGMTHLVDERLCVTGRAVIIDVHSYPTSVLPYELQPRGGRPHICLGTDGSHTPKWLESLAKKLFSPIGEVELNTPFAGTYVPLKHYGTAKDVSALMVEIRRDTYMTEPGGPPTSGIDQVIQVLTDLVNALEPSL